MSGQSGPGCYARGRQPLQYYNKFRQHNEQAATDAELQLKKSDVKNKDLFLYAYLPCKTFYCA